MNSKGIIGFVANVLMLSFVSFSHAQIEGSDIRILSERASRFS